MSLVVTVVALVAVATAVTAAARRTPVPAPLSLVLVGAGMSYVPWLPQVPLSPELVLVGLLPPLLYAAAVRTSLIDVRAHRSAIGFLAVGLVVVTAAAVGVVVSAVLDVPLAVGVALGAVVAPPDAVAATAIARRIGLPRRVVTVLEGESLVNDATALVTLRSAVAATAGAVTLGQVVGDFGFAVLVGLAVGVGVGVGISLLRTRLTDPAIDTTVSYLAPFLAYVPAEAVHASGVLAVVVTGVILGHRAPLVQTAASRVTERASWATVQFVLEHVVFLLIGLQARAVVSAVLASDVPAGTIVAVCGLTLAVVILVRPVVVAAVRVPLLYRGVNAATAGWAESVVVSWAGMRGVVTLAAAFSLPASFPHREVLILVALVVTVGTLLLQAMTLPWLSRRLGVVGPDPREDALQLANVLTRTTATALDTLERRRGPADDAVADVLRTLAAARVNAAWERLGRPESELETPSEAYRRLRLAMLSAQRAEAFRMRSAGQVDHEVLADAVAALDVEEATLQWGQRRTRPARGSVLRSPLPASQACPHLTAAPSVVTPASPRGCLDCEREGTQPVHLRLCLTCGAVGCCDSSPRQHARRHAAAHGHPVIRSFEPGEHWRWCYLDDVLG